MIVSSSWRDVCQLWLSMVKSSTGSSVLPLTVTIDIHSCSDYNQDWQSQLTFTIDSHNWHSQLTVTIDSHNWQSQLTFTIDIRNWHSQLTVTIDSHHWQSQLTVTIDRIDIRLSVNLCGGEFIGIYTNLIKFN